jgi:hypothetical protein
VDDIITADTRKVYQVTRYCCRSGNCFDCLAGFDKEKRKRVVQSYGLTEHEASVVAQNLRAYETEVERMPTGE